MRRSCAAKNDSPRLNRYQGESASEKLNYKYSGTTVTPTPFEPAVLEILAMLRELFPDDGSGLKLPRFNTCLMNYYRNGASPPRRASGTRACWHSASGRARVVQRLMLQAVRTPGDDRIGWHHDDNVARYGEDPVIASVSFGEERIFRLRRKADHAEQVDYSLGGGAILIMAGTCQSTWQHCVPARANLPTERINLTFRYVVNV